MKFKDRSGGKNLELITGGGIERDPGENDKMPPTKGPPGAEAPPTMVPPFMTEALSESEKESANASAIAVIIFCEFSVIGNQFDGHNVSMLVFVVDARVEVKNIRCSEKDR